MAGGFGWGYTWGKGLGQRAALLTEGAEALEESARMLRWQSTPLPELMAQLEATEGQLAPLFCHCREGLLRPDRRPFAQLWHSEVEHMLCLSSEERRVLDGAGGVLGRYESGEQAAALQAIGERLRQLAQQVEERQRRLGRMYCVLGCSGGILLTVLLI